MLGTPAQGVPPPSNAEVQGENELLSAIQPKDTGLNQIFKVKLNLKEPPTYKGERKHEAARNWMRKVNRYVEAIRSTYPRSAQIVTDEDWIRLISQYLEGFSVSLILMEPGVKP